MSIESDSKHTLIRHDGTPSTADRRSAWSLPPDLLSEAVRRLRAVALVYAVGHFVAGVLPPVVIPQARPIFLGSPSHWVPATLSIALALAVVAILSQPGLGDRAKTRVGLGFEVAASLGIAVAEYQHIAAPIEYHMPGPGGFGLSWVAVWVMLFSVVVPTPPRVALLTALLSVACVPIAYQLGVSTVGNVPLDPAQFFLSLIFPYSVVLLFVYVGSRVVYGLGAEVRRAREMGSYRLVELLGEGGMGEVWRAEHRMLARPAAIKLIRPRVLGADAADRRQAQLRFEREAQATSSMRSPHTLELYDFGVADDGTFYYVMELLDGFDLDALVSRFGPVPPERAVHFIRQMCDSLGEAHDAGLIHRDIKPANLYACRYGREVDFIKVLDFGLVKRGGAPERDADKLTAEHTAGGTPAYMSPEQAIGAGDVDARSDLYSVGCVAYWLITGVPVFTGRTPTETMMMHVHRQPEPPSHRITTALPRELEALVLACLAKEPDERPRSADELAARLSRVPIAEAWTAVRAREWWDTHRPAHPRPPIPA
jgi:serine/threonine-protein kinase